MGPLSWYLPAEALIETSRDTTVRFRLEPDPIAVRMIAAQVARLEERSRRNPFGRHQFDRTVMLRKRQSSAYDVIKDRLGPMRIHGVRCVFIDEVERGFGMEQLKMYLPDRLERIEVLTSREHGTMVRVYTREYIGKMVQGQRTIGPIILNRGMCR